MPATEWRRLNALAGMLWEAEASGRPARQLTAVMPEMTIADAYAIRREVDLLRMAHGAAPVGRKLALTARELLARTGAEEPAWGYIFSTGRCRNGATLDLRGLLRPQVEPEIAVTLGRDLDGPGVTRAVAAAAIASVHPAFEIVDIRTDIQGVVVQEVIADSCWNAGFLLGDGVPAAAVALDEIAVRVHSALAGSFREGCATDLLDGPLGCLAWLAEKLIAVGEPLRAGEIVLTGTLAGAIRLVAGDTLTAEFSGFGAEPAVVSVGGG